MVCFDLMGRYRSGLAARLIAARCVGAASVCAVAAGSFAWTAAAQAAKPTVSVVRTDRSGIAEGTSETIDAKCPGGYDVLGGSAFIGGNSGFAHIASAAPITDKRLYEVKVINPLVNPFAGIPDSDAAVTVGAICAQSGKPVVVDGPFGKPEPSGARREAGTVKLTFAEATGIENNSVTAVSSKCPSGSSAFGGGYAIGGSPWAHAASILVASKDNSFAGVFVHPPFDPTLGILRQRAAMRVLALCSETGRPLVLSSHAQVVHGGGSAAPRPKLRPTQPGNVVLVKRTAGGIKSGDVVVVSAPCPKGYSVFGGSYVISDSALAHATGAGVTSKKNAYEADVTNPPPDISGGLPKSTASVVVGALCAKNGQPIVIDTPFPQR